LREDFQAPLGLEPRKAAGRSGARAASLAAAGLALFGLAYGAKVYWPRSAPAGQASAPIETAAAPAPQPSAPATPPAAQAPAATADNGSDVKIVRGGEGGSSGALIIDIGQALGTKLAPAPDKRLVEKTKDGILPRIGADGSRAAEVYARPVIVSDKLKRGAPRIAIFVGAVGLDADVAEAAIKKLPPGVTLGLAPYGPDMARVAAEARENGHEIWLQAPMEGFGVAQNPGPHTLLAEGSAADNLDSLHWLMGRFVGYVGVANYLGGKFTSDSVALTPVLKDVADRGLLFLDDGTSPRSLVRDVAAPLNLLNARADLDLDADRANKSLEAGLIRLEAQARAQGSAIAVISALPDTIDAVARFARELEGRGILLTPVSALAGAGAKP